VNIELKKDAQGVGAAWLQIKLDLDVVHDVTQSLGTLLHLGQLGFAQLLTDQVRDALLADADRDAEEHFVRDAVPAFGQRAQRKHAPLHTQTTHAQTRVQGNRSWVKQVA